MKKERLFRGNPEFPCHLINFVACLTIFQSFFLTGLDTSTLNKSIGFYIWQVDSMHKSKHLSAKNNNKAMPGWIDLQAEKRFFWRFGCTLSMMKIIVFQNNFANIYICTAANMTDRFQILSPTVKRMREKRMKPNHHTV